MSAEAILQYHPAFAHGPVSEPAPARLLLIEPNEVARLGIHSMLQHAAPEAAADSATSWWHAEVAARRDLPDVLLVSSEVEGQPSPELADRLKQAGAKVVLIVRSVDPARLQGLLRLPISAVLREADLSVAAVAQLLGSLANGLVAMPQAAAQQLLGLAASQRSAGPMGRPNLTARETDVLKHMADGMSNREIARELRISEHGVKRHVANLLAKLNCHNRTMAVTTAIQLALLTP